MAVLEIKKYPDIILTERAVSVGKIDRSLQRLIDDMIETMYAAPGVGLAAPQVGVSQRLIVVDISMREEGAGNPLVVLINPEIVEHEGQEEGEEGCLSLPGYTTSVKRFSRILVKGLDRSGKPLKIEGSGLLSRALQHEIDHINGTLIIDRISPIKREFYKKKIKKALAKTF
jgi:peptide deformylase